MMNTLERFCSYNEIMLDRQSVNDKRTDKRNATFDAVIQSDTGRGRMSLKLPALTLFSHKSSCATHTSLSPIL